MIVGLQGVELSHRAVVWTVAGVRKYLQLVGYDMNCNDSQISYLPLAHIFDRSAMSCDNLDGFFLFSHNL